MRYEYVIDHGVSCWLHMPSDKYEANKKEFEKAFREALPILKEGIVEADLLDFCQYILDEWELDTRDIQDRATKLIEKYGGRE